MPKAIELYRAKQLNRIALQGAHKACLSVLDDINKARTLEETEKVYSRLLTEGFLQATDARLDAMAESRESAIRRDIQRKEEMNSARQVVRSDEQVVNQLMHDIKRSQEQIVQLKANITQIEVSLQELSQRENPDKKQEERLNKQLNAAKARLSETERSLASLQEKQSVAQNALEKSRDALQDLQRQHDEELSKYREKLAAQVEEMSASVKRNFEKCKAREDRRKKFWKWARPSLRSPFKSALVLAIVAVMPIIPLAILVVQDMRAYNRVNFLNRNQDPELAFERKRNRLGEKAKELLLERLAKLDIKESRENKAGEIKTSDSTEAATEGIEKGKLTEKSSESIFSMAPDGSVREQSDFEQNSEELEQRLEEERMEAKQEMEPSPAPEKRTPSLNDDDKRAIANKDVQSALSVKGKSPFLAQNANGRFYNGASQLILRADIVKRGVMPVYIDRKQVEDAGLTVRTEGVSIYVPSKEHPGEVVRKKVYNIEDTDFKEKYSEVFEKVKEKFESIKNYESLIDRSINRSNAKILLSGLDEGIANSPDIERIAGDMAEAAATYDRDYFERDVPEEYVNKTAFSESGEKNAVELQNDGNPESVDSEMTMEETEGATFDVADKAMYSMYQKMVDAGLLSRHGGFNFDGMVRDADIEIENEREMAEQSREQRDERLLTGGGRIEDASSVAVEITH